MLPRNQTSHIKYMLHVFYFFHICYLLALDKPLHEIWIPHNTLSALPTHITLKIRTVASERVRLEEEDALNDSRVSLISPSWSKWRALAKKKTMLHNQSRRVTWRGSKQGLQSIIQPWVPFVKVALCSRPPEPSLSCSFPSVQCCLLKKNCRELFYGFFSFFAGSSAVQCIYSTCIH